MQAKPVIQETGHTGVHRIILLIDCGLEKMRQEILSLAYTNKQMYQNV